MFWRWLTLFSLMLIAAGIRAEDLGKIGPVYEITERDLIEVIQAKLIRAQNNGELARFEADYKRHVIASLEQPKPIAGIRPTQAAKTHYIDPTWTLDRDVVNDRGKLLYPAGTRVNPFDYDRLTRPLLFIDASDHRQVAFAKVFIERSPVPVKPILVAGEPFKLMREWKREVYFDQGSTLSKRLDITHSPVLVTQEGKRLRIDELRP